MTRTGDRPKSLTRTGRVQRKRRPRFFRFCCSVAMVPVILFSNGCGGGGEADGGGSPIAVTPTPPPTPSPTPTPTPTPTTAAALIEPKLTPSPPSPLAEDGGLSFAALGGGAQLPLLLTAITTQFAGDAATTEQGGTISSAPDGVLRLTLNNSALGVAGVSLTGEKTNIEGGTIQSFVPVSRGQYVRNGSWFIQKNGGPIGGVWATGFSTPPASIPTASVATYTGVVSGLVSEFHIPDGGGVALLSGDVTFSLNFATRVISGEITGLRVGSDGTYVTGLVNNLSFNAMLNPGTSTYIGEVIAGPSPGGPNAFLAGARGMISGQLFQQKGLESGAVLILSDGASRLLISFSASVE